MCLVGLASSQSASAKDTAHGPHSSVKSRPLRHSHYDLHEARVERARTHLDGELHPAVDML